MGRHIIPADSFFTYSPEIHIRCKSTADETVLEAIAWTQQHGKKGGEINCFLRPSCDEERDGHLARLIGARKMHALLHELQDQATLYYHKKKYGWYVSYDEHPCGMLSFNDKWWMSNWDAKHLSRYGHQKRMELSCIPQQFKDSFHMFSVQSCLYCNGDYDDTIPKTLGMQTKGAGTRKGPWTERYNKENEAMQ